MKRFLKHLTKEKQDLKEHIEDIINENNGFRYCSLNLYFAVNRLKEIETIEQFLASDDFEEVIYHA